MGYEDIDRDIQTGKIAAAAVAAQRETLRWRSTPGDPQRELAISDALAKIADAMEPLRSHIGRLIWEPLPQRREDDLRAVSKRLQYERRQLKKMRRTAAG